MNHHPSISTSQVERIESLSHFWSFTRTAISFELGISGLCGGHSVYEIGTNAHEVIERAIRLAIERNVRYDEGPFATKSGTYLIG